jgi:hypothetical protein
MKLLATSCINSLYGRGFNNSTLSSIFTLSNSVDKMIELSMGSSTLRKESLREGIVVREILNSHISFKVINPEFLLKHKL